MIVLPFFALTANAAWAQDDMMCRNGLFPSEPPFAPAEVQGRDRAFFHADMNGCPWSGNDCRARTYLVPGDKVITGRFANGYACTFYPSKGRGTAGWMRVDRLRPLPVEADPPHSAWAGKWSSEGNPQVHLREEGGRILVEGVAFWPGPEPTQMYPSPHIGEIHGPISVFGNRGRYSDENLCEIDFTLLGDFLIAGDNGQCGGMNVSFSAVYRRVRP